MPVIGWVFKDNWGEKIKILKFLKSSDEAKKDAEWMIYVKIRPNMNAEDDLLFPIYVTFTKVFERNSQNQIDGARKTFSILSKIGGKFVGSAKELSPGTFWSN